VWLSEESISFIVYLLVVYHVFAAFFSTAPPFPLHLIIASIVPIIAQGQITLLVTTVTLLPSVVFIALHLLAGFESLMHTHLGWFLGIFLTAFWILSGIIVILLLSPITDTLAYAWVLANFAVFAALWRPKIRTLFETKPNNPKTKKKR
jgi:hypothetical protein